MDPKIQGVSYYEILQPLASGGMGVVYKARDLRLDRIVALKFLPADLAANPVQRERFIQEAKAASLLDHPNICTIYEIGSTPDGRVFIAMPFYEGDTVKHKIAQGPMELIESADIATQVAQGLAKAHSKGIIHRDIKPANLIVTNDSIVKILDFGVAKLNGGSGLTRSGTLLGTVAYMSPEQISGETDQRTDLWSLGVVLYEMLTGQHPFCAEKEATTIYQILHVQPSRPVVLRPETPPHLERILSRLLEKDRAMRYSRAEELLEDLRRFQPKGSIDLATTSELSGSFLQMAPPSIAVLPFNNLSRETEAEYFGDGLAEELIYALSQVDGLHVVSRVSAFEFKGKSHNLGQIGQQLKVRSVLTGSVRMAGDRLRVNVEMTNIADGYCLWSARFDRDMKDVFAIQDEIASHVVSNLKLRLEDQTHSVAQRYVGNPDAYNLYLKGRYYFNRNTEQGFRKAGECFGRAIAVDSQCAPACAGLAEFYMAMGFWSVTVPAEAWPKAREFAAKAMQLDPRNPDAHITLAKVYQFSDWDRSAAEGEFRRAVQLNPNHSEARFAYSVFLLQAGQLYQSLEEIKRAHDLDPLNLSIATGVAWLHYYRGDYYRAMDQCQQVFELSPDYPEAQGCLALCSEKIGHPADSVVWLEKTTQGSAELPFVLGLLGRAYALNGQREKAVEMQHKLQTISKQRYTSQVAHALVALGLGDLDLAMQWLEEALQAHDAFLCYAKVFPPYDPLRDRPRFQEMLQRMGLADTRQLGSHPRGSA